MRIHRTTLPKIQGHSHHLEVCIACPVLRFWRFSLRVCIQKFDRLPSKFLPNFVTRNSALFSHIRSTVLQNLSRSEKSKRTTMIVVAPRSACAVSRRRCDLHKFDRSPSKFLPSFVTKNSALFSHQIYRFTEFHAQRNLKIQTNYYDCSRTRECLCCF